MATNALADYTGMERVGAAMGLSTILFLGSFLTITVLSVIFWACAWHTRLVQARIFAKDMLKKRSKHKIPWPKLILCTMGVDLIFQIPMLISTLIVKNKGFGQTMYGLMTMDLLWTIASFPFDMLIAYLVYRAQHKIRNRIKQRKAGKDVQN